MMLGPEGIEAFGRSVGPTTRVRHLRIRFPDRKGVGRFVAAMAPLYLQYGGRAIPRALPI